MAATQAAMVTPLPDPPQRPQISLDFDVKSYHDLSEGWVKEPLSPSDARKLIREILDLGVVAPSGHALKEMANDDLTMVDCTNVLRGGFPDPPEFEKESWRYRVRTPRMSVVVAFLSERKLVIVTAWREKP